MAGRKQFDPDIALSAAVRQFWDHGFQATSIRDLESVTGVGRASLYSTFGDKDDLFLRALTAYVDQHGPPVREAFRIHEGDSRRALRATFDATLRRMSDRTLPAGCLIAQSTAELTSLGPRARAMLSRLLADQLAIIASSIRGDVRRGQLDWDTDAEALAAFFAGTIHSLSTLHRNGVDLAVLRRVTDHALTTLGQDAPPEA